MACKNIIQSDRKERWRVALLKFGEKEWVKKLAKKKGKTKT